MNVGYNIGSFNAFEESIAVCPTKVIQIFTHNTKPFQQIVTDNDFARIKEYIVYVHSTFNTIIDHYAGRSTFRDQFLLCNKYNFKGIVLHIPNRPVSQLVYGFKCLDDPTLYNKNTIVFLEHVPGDYGSSLDMVHELYIGLSNKYKGFKFGICVDTCHMYSSGVNLSMVSKMTEIIDKLKSFNVPILIHLNDSNGELGSLIDHHAPLGTRIWAKDKSSLKLLLSQPWDAIIELKPIDKIKESLDFINK